MPQPIRTAQSYPAFKDIVFPQDAEKLKTDPSHDPCVIFIPGELTEVMYEYVTQNVVDFVNGEAVENPAKTLAVITDLVFQPFEGRIGKWNLTDASGDDIPFTRAEFNKLDNKDKRGWIDDDKQRHPGLKELFVEYYQAQLSEMATVEATDKELQSDSPLSEAQHTETPGDVIASRHGHVVDPTEALLTQ